MLFLAHFGPFRGNKVFFSKNMYRTLQSSMNTNEPWGMEQRGHRLCPIDLKIVFFIHNALLLLFFLLQKLVIIALHILSMKNKIIKYIGVLMATEHILK